MNFLGFDVAGLDVEAWARQARMLYFVVALVGLVWAVRRRSPALLLGGVLLANTWAFVVTTWPLQRLYALGGSRDRLNNVGLCQVVAAGSPVLETAQPGQLHFEPFWGLLMALLAGFDHHRLLQLYSVMPLATVLAFVLALEWGWRPPRAPDTAGAGGLGPWERALVAGFATLLCAGPLDYLSLHRTSWALMFLLKPNHALGLALLPVVLRLVARAESWRGRVFAGFVLHVMGWAFVIHMGFTACGLALHALATLVCRRPDARRDLADAATVLGVNLLIVSPYLYMLLVGYPFLVPRTHATIHAGSPHLLEITTRLGWLLPLAVYGTWRSWRAGDRLGRLWAAQGVSALILWAACLPLGWFALAREVDEFYHWARFVFAALAARGAWDLAPRAIDSLRAALAMLSERRGRAAGLLLLGWRRVLGAPHEQAARPALAAGLVTLLVLPATLPAWWDPPRMDAFFTPSLTPLPPLLEAPNRWLREHSRPDDVVAGDHEYMAWVAALAGRRVLMSARLNAPSDAAQREALERDLLSGDDAQAARRAVEGYRVRYLVATGALLHPMGLSLEKLEGRRHLRQVHLTRQGPQRFVAIYRIEPEAGS